MSDFQKSAMWPTPNMCLAQEWHRDGRGLWAMRSCEYYTGHGKAHAFGSWKLDVQPPESDEIAFLRTRDAHADEVIQARNQRLSELAVESDKLRAALVGIVGVDGRAELERMEVVMRMMPAPAEDKARTIDAIHALLATLPSAQGEDAAQPAKESLK
jgi:hypothetical protein